MVVCLVLSNCKEQNSALSAMRFPSGYSWKFIRSSKLSEIALSANTTSEAAMVEGLYDEMDSMSCVRAASRASKDFSIILSMLRGYNA